MNEIRTEQLLKTVESLLPYVKLTDLFKKWLPSWPSHLGLPL